jgi:hypothetical protein
LRELLELKGLNILCKPQEQSGFAAMKKSKSEIPPPPQKQLVGDMVG